jgi:hypothetical protein
MTLSQALKAIGDGLYALFVYREPEPFDYARDVDELTMNTASFKKPQH